MAPKFAEPTVEQLNAAKIISGPFLQFNDSVIFEYLEPPAWLDATYYSNGIDTYCSS
jgi:hypothetical protein